MQSPRAGKRQDVYVALMGLTGTGKSTFISHFTKGGVVIGHGMESCTKEVKSHSFRYNKTTTVHLIDSPGFDDTHAADHKTLEELAAFLKLSYQNNAKLSGIIYLHRITDVRMTGSSMKSLSIFKKLVGDDAYSRVILATNRWEEVQNAIGEEREEQLTSNSGFWGVMRTKGCQIRRLMNTKDSAMDLIRYFLAESSAPIVLDIQKELVDNGRQLIDTAVGREAAGQHEQELKSRKMEHDAVKKEFRELLKARNETAALELNKERARIVKVVQDLEKSFQYLRIDMERQLEQRVKRLGAEMQQMFQTELQLQSHRNKNGETPLFKAASNRHMEVARTIRDALGGKTSGQGDSQNLENAPLSRIRAQGSRSPAPKTSVQGSQSRVLGGYQFTGKSQPRRNIDMSRGHNAWDNC